MTSNRALWFVSALCVFRAGVIVGGSGVFDAHAEEPVEVEGELEAFEEAEGGAAAYGGSSPMLCRAFQLDSDEPTIDTTNPKTAAGGWVSDREAEGWVMYGIDFEMSTKHTGYPAAWAQICLYQPV